MESCRIVGGPGWGRPRLSGTVVGYLGTDPYACHYAVTLDDRWQTRRVHLDLTIGDAETRPLVIERDDENGWTFDGDPVPGVATALDIDLAFTPATNTLPMRRLALAEGESATVLAAWFRFPELRLEPLHQRYTRLDATTYRYESDTGFLTTIVTDDLGLVVTYEAGWERVGST